MKIQKLLLLYIIYDFHNENIEYKEKIRIIKSQITRAEDICKNMKHYEYFKNCRLYCDNVKNNNVCDIPRFFERFKQKWYNKNINNLHYILDLQEKKHLEYLIKINKQEQPRKKFKI